MSNESKQDYLATIRTRYLSSSKKEKKKILDEFCNTCNYHRKYAIRKLNEKEKKEANKKGKRGRKKRYNLPELKELLLEISVSTIDRLHRVSRNR